MSLLWSPKKAEGHQTPPRGCRLSEAATSLNSPGVLAFPYVGQRNDHQDALGAGLGVRDGGSS
jgi:chromosome partitioning protein